MCARVYAAGKCCGLTAKYFKNGSISSPHCGADTENAIINPKSWKFLQNILHSYSSYIVVVVLYTVCAHHIVICVHAYNIKRRCECRTLVLHGARKTFSNIVPILCCIEKKKNTRNSEYCKHAADFRRKNRKRFRVNCSSRMVSARPVKCAYTYARIRASVQNNVVKYCVRTGHDPNTENGPR